MPDPRDQVERLLDQVGLDVTFRGKLIGTYSTGMKRPVEIARALMGGRKCYSSTNPHGGLTCPRSARCGASSAGSQFDENFTTFLSSHDSYEIRSLCDEISVID